MLKGLNKNVTILSKYSTITYHTKNNYCTYNNVSYFIIIQQESSPVTPVSIILTDFKRLNYQARGTF